MKLVQRRTYAAELQWREATGPLLDYYVAAEVEAERRQENHHDAAGSASAISYGDAGLRIRGWRG